MIHIAIQTIGYVCANADKATILQTSRHVVAPNVTRRSKLHMRIEKNNSMYIFYIDYS